MRGDKDGRRKDFGFVFCQGPAGPGGNIREIWPAAVELRPKAAAGPQDAQECLNDTYLAAWDRIPPARPQSLFAWLCRVLRNHCCDRYRRESTLKRSALVVELSQELENTLLSPPPGEEEGLSELLDKFLRSLDKSSRILFVRRYFYADSLQELSAMTALGANTIAARLARMRKKLRKILLEEGYTV